MITLTKLIVKDETYIFAMKRKRDLNRLNSLCTAELQKKILFKEVFVMLGKLLNKSFWFIWLNQHDKSNILAAIFYKFAPSVIRFAKFFHVSEVRLQLNLL